MTRTPAIAIVALLGVGCTTVTDTITAPPAPAPSSTVDPSPRVYVLNTQFRGVINPEIVPSSAYGHIQLKLTDAGDGTYTVEWVGKIFNPNRETFLTAEIHDVGLTLPGDGGPPPLLDLFNLTATGGVDCSIIDFDSYGVTDEENLPSPDALALISSPSEYVVIFSTQVNSLAVAGWFGAGPDPDLVGFNPQPDPPKGSARCGV
ncbi:MAG TPA: hypothetical protein VF981_09295 [Gemmatimonadaceae bacterium]